MIRNYITNIIVVIILLVGIIAIGGWVTDVERFRPFFSSISSTKFNTALCLIFSAIALYVFNRQHRPSTLYKIGLTAAWLVVAIASLTLLEYVTNVKLGLDQFIVRDIGDKSNPGRIELTACLMFLTIGTILVELRSRKRHILIQVFLPLVFFAAVFITFNYISGLGYLETMEFAIKTALTTSLSIMALCVGIFYSYPLREIKFSFEKKIASYFGVAILLLGIVFFSFTTNNINLIESAKQVAHTKDVLFKTSTVLNQAQDIETGTRGFTITGKEEFLEPFNRSSVDILVSIEEVRKLTKKDGLQQRRVDTLFDLAKRNVALRSRIIDLKRSKINQPFIANILINAEKRLMDSLRAVVSSIQTREEATLAKSTKESNDTISGAQRIITIIEILVLLILVVVFLIIYRNTLSRNKAEAALRKSEQFTRSVVDNATTNITIKDLDGRYLLVNKQASKLFNKPERDVVGKTLFDFYDSEYAKQATEADKDVLRQKTAIESEVETHFNGISRHHIAVRFPLFDENEIIYAIGATSTDITAIKQAQAVIQKSHQQQQVVLNSMQDLLEASLDVICVVDVNGFITQISANCRNLLGYEPAEMMGAHFGQFVVRDETASVAQDPVVVDKKMIRNFENRARRKDGTPVPLTGTAIWSPETKSFFAIVKDATERKMTARQLEELNDSLKKRAAELQASNTELERFAYVASHDLQEPLRMVSSFLQLLENKLEGALDETGKKYIDFAIDGAERMKTLIQDLLQYSRIGTSKELVVNVNMDEILSSVKTIYGLAIRESSAELVIHPLPVIKAEKGQMHQLFQNLIGNAIKYSSPSPPKIEVGFEELPNEWQFYVRDEGIGINPKFFEKIFVIFQRLHNKTEFSGTGIGLAICKKIVERHGGVIWVESEAGKGSCFFVRLPKY